MKLNKLLLAASIAALTATSASALELTVNTPANAVTPALELEFPQPATNTTTLNFTLTPTTVGGEFPAGNNIAVGITLPLGTSFASPVGAGDVTGNGASDVATIVQRAGQVNNGSVELLISLPQNDTTTEIAFDFDVKLDQCPATAQGLIVSAATENGTPIEDGTVSSDSFVAPCRSAVNVAIFDDEALFGATPAGPGGTPPATPGTASDPNGDTFIQLPDYTTLSDPIVGFINGSIDPDVARSIDGTPVDNTDITSVSFDLVLEDTTGLDRFELPSLGVNVPIVDGVLSYQVTLTGGDKDAFFDGVEDEIELYATGAEQVLTQQLRVEDVITRFNDTNANFVPREFYTDGNIDFLQREGKQFGVFDWNSGPNGALTDSVYRVTGVDQVQDTPYTITLSNARPATAEGTYRGVIPAALSAAQNGEIVLRSIDKWGQTPGMPDFVRADALVNFESDANIDVDRLLSRSGVVTSFGGGANGDFLGFANQGEQPTADGDQFSPGGGGSTE